tara:strand:- start:47449 stop:47595 length:147 start_codon:yes stop_codon:yes gene_type:complete
MDKEYPEDLDQDHLNKLKKRLNHDPAFRVGINIVGFPIEYVAAMTQKK